MNFLYSMFFGAGVAAFVYAKFGRRIGYTNTQNIWLFVGAIFLFATFFFYTLAAFVLHLH